MKRINESNALDALLGILPAITGSTYSKGGTPDELDSRSKEVDFVLIPDSSDFPKLAVEHTVVEAYRGQKTYLNRSYKIVQKVDFKCRGSLPGDRSFALVPPPELVDQLQHKEVDKFVEFISPWVIKMAAVLMEDDYKTTQYAGLEVLLLCNGPIPGHNGMVGRMPGAPKNQKELVAQSLWLGIEHGIGKFAKYKDQGYGCVHVVENVSGIAHPTTLIELAKDPHKQTLINTIDYVIEFASNEDRMVVGNVWKEKRIMHAPVPYNRRFHKVEGKWTSMG